MAWGNDMAVTESNAPGQPPLVRCSGVGKTWQTDGAPFVALRDIDLEIGRGEFVVFLGPSGCGKSTLLYLMAGLDRVSQGSIICGGGEVRAPGTDRGLVFQDASLFPWLTVGENVTFGLKMQHVPPERRRRTAQEILARVGLSEAIDERPDQLSGGMRERVAVGRALALNPEILLLDEPFAALDVQTRAKMQDFLIQVWRQSKVSMVFVTHHIDEAISLADRIVVFTARPGRVKTIIAVDLPRARHPQPGVPRHERPPDGPDARRGGPHLRRTGAGQVNDTLHVAALQLPPCTTDLAANRAVALRAVREAADGAQLVALPELSTVPYFASAPGGSYATWAETANGELATQCAALARQCGITLFVSFYEFDPATGCYHNAVLGFDASGAPLHAVPVARKLHLPVGDDPPPGYDEAAHFTPGDALHVVRSGDWRIGVLICYDRRFPECWRALRAAGADLVIVPVAGSGGDDMGFFVGEMRTHARENGLAVVCANKSGDEFLDGVRIDNYGESCVIAADGTVLVRRGGAQGAGIVAARLRHGDIAATRARLAYFSHRRTDLYGTPSF
jgi:ABC-type nitrate/sulfonate/bicarbonate transport system ATPase subunit/predicted amidohydrolase